MTVASVLPNNVFTSYYDERSGHRIYVQTDERVPDDADQTVYAWRTRSGKQIILVVSQFTLAADGPVYTGYRLYAKSKRVGVIDVRTICTEGGARKLCTTISCDDEKPLCWQSDPSDGPTRKGKQLTPINLTGLNLIEEGGKAFLGCKALVAA